MRTLSWSRWNDFVLSVEDKKVIWRAMEVMDKLAHGTDLSLVPEATRMRKCLQDILEKANAGTVDLTRGENI